MNLNYLFKQKCWCSFIKKIFSFLKQSYHGIYNKTWNNKKKVHKWNSHNKSMLCAHTSECLGCIEFNSMFFIQFLLLLLLNYNYNSLKACTCVSAVYCILCTHQFNSNTSNTTTSYVYYLLLLSFCVCVCA